MDRVMTCSAIPGQMHISAVILAAGSSRRFGGNKLLAEIRGKTVLQHVVDAARNSPVDSVILVISGETAGSFKDTNGISVVINNNPAAGLSYSVRLGIQEASKHADAALVMLGDMPNITSGIIEKFTELSRKNPESIISGMVRNEFMVPAVFPRSLFGEMKKLSGDFGARAIIQGFGNVVPVELKESDIIDIDVRSDVNRFGSR